MITLGLRVSMGGGDRLLSDDWNNIPWERRRTDTTRPVYLFTRPFSGRGANGARRPLTCSFGPKSPLPLAENPPRLASENIDYLQ
ncbi:hypothetical protein EVAR_57038_1 [Eumeta japonica]|uniref:Uncharacterized protein n=1 Tax=Eumeta variegata TaxID=151549 RepID=A0A4C1YRR1_EUMVA|nr:hypothetical protein EVAR_57038_1 [Eumeta japonica]